MKHLIVNINPSVVKSCIQIERPSGRLYSCEDITVFIGRRKRRRPTPCKPPEPSCDGYVNVFRYSDPRHGLSRCGCDDDKSIGYHALDVDDEGRVCFYWDDLLYNQPPGRYHAIVRHRDGTCLGSFQIELSHDRPRVIDAANVMAIDNCEFCE